MPYRFFTIPTIHSEGVERELNAFLAQHQNVRVEKQFVANGEQSFWAVAVTYAAGREPGSPAAFTPKVKYEEQMSEEQYAFYTELRALRNQIAEEAKVPAYNVFNNAELAAMVTKRPATLAELQKIKGIGKKKVDGYGQLFLGELRKWRDSANQAPALSEAGATAVNGDEAGEQPF